MHLVYNLVTQTLEDSIECSSTHGTERLSLYPNSY